MSAVKIFNSNLATDDLTEITATSTNSLYPLSNIKNARSTSEWRSETGVVNASVIFDFKTIESVTTVMVKGHHLDGLGFTSLTIEANPTANFSSPAFSTTLTPSLEWNFGLKEFSAESYRFWRLSPVGGSSFTSLNNVFIGSGTTFTSNNIDYGWTYRDNDLSRKSTNRYGQIFADEITKQRELGSLKFSIMNKTEVDQVFAIFDENGTTRPVWVIIDSDETISNDFERFAGQFYIDSTPNVTNAHFSLYDTSINVTEVI